MKNKCQIEVFQSDGQDPDMKTFGLIEAAEFIGLHPNTLQSRAKSGEIPGAKIGKEWRFIDVDLAEYMRTQYPANKEAKPWRSTVSVKRITPTSLSRDAELEKLLQHTPRNTDRKPHP
jgi:excisionase family DNA binding protein